MAIQNLTRITASGFLGLFLFLVGCGVSMEFLNPVGDARNDTGIPSEKYSAEEHYEFGQVFSENGKNESARFQYRRSLRKDSKFYRARIALGNQYLKQGNYERAEEYYSRVIDRKPRNPTVISNLAWCWIKQDEQLDRAISLLLEGSFHNPEHSAAFFDSIAYTYVKKGKGKTALAILNRELNTKDVPQTQYPYLFFSRARALKLLNRPWKSTLKMAAVLCRTELLQKEIKTFAREYDVEVTFLFLTNEETGSKEAGRLIEHWISSAVEMLSYELKAATLDPGKRRITGKNGTSPGNSSGRLTRKIASRLESKFARKHGSGNNGTSDAGSTPVIQVNLTEGDLLSATWVPSGSTQTKRTIFIPIPG